MAVRVSFHGRRAPADLHEGPVDVLGKDIGAAFDIGAGEVGPAEGVTEEGLYQIVPDAEHLIYFGGSDLVFFDAANGNRYPADMPITRFLEVGDKIAVGTPGGGL